MKTQFLARLALFLLTVIGASGSLQANANSINQQTKKEKTMTIEIKPGKNTVTFKSFGVDLVGNLYVPEDFDPNKKYKAIVGASPFPQVKEQVLGCVPMG